MRRLFAAREAGVLLALFVLCVGLSIASPYFFTLRNIFNVLQGMSTIGIMAIGMTIVLIAGGLDLSVGSVLAVGGMLAARLMTYSGLNPWLAVAAGLIAGVAIGAVNGLLVTRARLSGIAVERVQLITYVVCGGLAALAGIVTTGLLATASTNLGQGVELDVIAAAVIGGTSLRGGEGSVIGTLIGAGIMAVVRNAFVLLGLPLHLQVMIIGVVILLAVGLDRRRRR